MQVTYIGRAGRIRITPELVLERNVPTEVPPSVARGLSPRDFDVVQPRRRSPATRRTTTKPGRARRSQKES